MLTKIRRELQKMWREAHLLYHRRRLKQRVAPNSKEYQQYLDIQLRRTLSKRHAGFQENARLLIDKTANLTDLTSCDVLCVGCRNLAEIEYFRSEGARRVVGIDLYSDIQDILVMDMHRMTFPDSRFDVIYSSHSLEHAYNVRRAASEIVRVARSGALVAIEVPVTYETRGADLVDFENLQGMYAVFRPHIGQVLWSDEQPAHSASNEKGTAIIRAVFSISKDNHRATLEDSLE